MKLFLSLALILAASSAFCQTSLPPAKPGFRAGQPVTLTWAQLTRTVHQTDSLMAVAASARKTAARWQGAALNYRASRDSLRVALVAKVQEVDRQRDKVVDLNRLLVSQAATTEKYRTRAHRKGWLLGLVSTALGGATYLFITH